MARPSRLTRAARPRPGPSPKPTSDLLLRALPAATPSRLRIRELRRLPEQRRLRILRLPASLQPPPVAQDGTAPLPRPYPAREATHSPRAAATQMLHSR